MATTAQLRQWWVSYLCDVARYTYVTFPGVDREWRLPVTTPSVDLWRAFAEVMTAHGYLFRESAGGTYNCRKIAGSDNYSLHAYAIALDLNPSKNPFNTQTTDMPEAFRDDLKAIRTTQGTQAFTWGGDWATGSDPMHWQLNVPPSDTQLEDDTMTKDEILAELGITAAELGAIKQLRSAAVAAGREVSFERPMTNLFNFEKAKSFPGGGGLTEAQVKAIVNDSQIVAPE